MRSAHSDFMNVSYGPWNMYNVGIYESLCTWMQSHSRHSVCDRHRCALIEWAWATSGDKHGSGTREFVIELIYLWNMARWVPALKRWPGEHPISTASRRITANPCWKNRIDGNEYNFISLTNCQSNHDIDVCVEFDAEYRGHRWMEFKVEKASTCKDAEATEIHPDWFQCLLYWLGAFSVNGLDSILHSISFNRIFPIHWQTTVSGCA